MSKGRFRVVLDETDFFTKGSKVIKDVETGVLYLFHSDGHQAGGLTPLLDSDGKPMVRGGRKNVGTKQ